MSAAKRYRKRPVVIEAFCWAGGPGAASEVIDWVLAGGGTARYACDNDAACAAGDPGHHLAIDTLEGTMRAEPGDYIIRGVQGEHYPCKPAIFAETYTLA